MKRRSHSARKTPAVPVDFFYGAFWCKNRSWHLSRQGVYRHLSPFSFHSQPLLGRGREKSARSQYQGSTQRTTSPNTCEKKGNMILRQPFFLALSFLNVLSSPMRAISHSCLRERNAGFFSQNVEDTVLYSTAVVRGKVVKNQKKGLFVKQLRVSQQDGHGTVLLGHSELKQ